MIITIAFSSSCPNIPYISRGKLDISTYLFTYIPSIYLTTHKKFIYIYLYLYLSNYTMIRFFLLQNKQGKTRLSKWFVPMPEETERLKLENDINRIISQRGKGYTNFVEFQNIKLIYRRYAGLYFVYGVDINENELMMMETIHLFVELLDQYFSNVCEVR